MTAKGARLQKKAVRATCIVAMAATLAAIPSLASSAVVNGDCAASAMKFAASTSEIVTAKPGFNTIPETTVNFNQGSAGCLIVQFYWTYIQDVGPITNLGTTSLRALLDNSKTGLPDQFWLTRNPGVAVSPAYFVFPNVAPGAHNIRMQYGNPTNSRRRIGKHNTIVHYTP